MLVCGCVGGGVYVRDRDDSGLFVLDSWKRVNASKLALPHVTQLPSLLPVLCLANLGATPG